MAYYRYSDLELKKLNADLDFNSYSALNLKSAMGVVNVKGFGAKGDGITDDSAAIQAAIDSITAGTVFIPRGTYICNSKLTLKSNIWLIGSGATLEFTDTTANGIEAIGTDANKLYGIVIDGLRIVGQGATHSGNGIHFEYVVPYGDFQIVSIRNTVVSNFGNYQLYMSNCYGGNVSVKNCYFGGYGVGNGVYLYLCNGFRGENWEVHHYKENGIGVMVERGQPYQFKNVICETEELNAIGFYITGDGTRAVTIDGCYTETMTIPVKVDGLNVVGVNIRGSHLAAETGGTGILIDNAKSVIIEGNHFYGNYSKIIDVTSNATDVYIGVNDYSEVTSGTITNLATNYGVPIDWYYRFDVPVSAVEDLDRTGSSGLITKTAYRISGYQYRPVRAVLLRLKIHIDSVGSSGAVAIIVNKAGGDAKAEQQLRIPHTVAVAGEYYYAETIVETNTSGQYQYQLWCTSGVGWQFDSYIYEVGVGF